MYPEYAFGAAKLTFPDIDSAHTAAAAITQLEAGHATLVDDLAGLYDASLDREVLTNRGAKWPAQKIFWTMIMTAAVALGAKYMNDHYKPGMGITLDKKK